MAGQNELEQVGLEVGLEEPVVQDDTPMQEDISPQPNPEGVLGVAGAAYDTPPPPSNSPLDPWRIRARPRRIGFVRVI